VLRSYAILRQELKNLGEFYSATSSAYQQVEKLSCDLDSAVTKPKGKSRQAAQRRNRRRRGMRAGLAEVGKLNPGHAGGPSIPAGVLPLRTDGSHTAVGPQDASLIEAWRGCDRPSTPAFWTAPGGPASPEQRGRSGG